MFLGRLLCIQQPAEKFVLFFLGVVCFCCGCVVFFPGDSPKHILTCRGGRRSKHMEGSNLLVFQKSCWVVALSLLTAAKISVCIKQ